MKEEKPEGLIGQTSTPFETVLRSSEELLKRLGTGAFADGSLVKEGARSYTNALPEKVEPENFLRRSREALERRQRSIRSKLSGIVDEVSGEDASRFLLSDVQLIKVKHIQNDPAFRNTRIFQDLDRPSEVGSALSMEALEQSILAEGIKTPLHVIQIANSGAPDWTPVYAVRAGFRRFACIKKLLWSEFPAVVIPKETHIVDQYWINILENTTRKNLATYEVAQTAKLMRDDFDIAAAEFARRTGYSAGYISKLLSCLDKLPPLIIDHWKDGTLLAFDDWYKLSLLDHDQAIRTFRKWMGLRPKEEIRRVEEAGARGSGRQLAPAWYVNRLQRLYIGIAGSDKLPPRTRDLTLKVIEYCMGQTDKIPGVYDPNRQRDYEKRAKLRNELRMPGVPEPGDEPNEIPPPAEEVDDDDDD